jgi:hypothetical protein
MKRTYKVAGGFLAFLSALPTVVSAQSVGIGIGIGGGSGNPSSVPEIDASTGAMALAALGAALLLTWEINRRRKSA